MIDVVEEEIKILRERVERLEYLAFKMAADQPAQT